MRSHPRSRRSRPPFLHLLVTILGAALVLAGCSLGGGTPPTPTAAPVASPAASPAAGGTAAPGGTAAAGDGGVVVRGTAPAIPAFTAGGAGTPGAVVIPPGLLVAPNGELRKVDSILLDTAQIYQRQGPQAAEQFARDSGLLNSNNELRITLILSDTNRAPVEDRVRGLGGRVVASVDNTIELVFPLAALGPAANNRNLLQELASFTTVQEIRVTPLLEPRGGFGGAEGTTREELRAALQPLVSEGVRKIGADRWAAAGLTGRGVKVGIIDLEFKNYAQLLGQELPAQVVARTFRSDNTYGDGDHGTACAEIIHELAPDAELYIAAAQTNGEVANALQYMVQQGVKVVSMSIGNSVSRGDGSGVGARAVDDARQRGVLVVVAAGNEGDEHYAGTFTDADNDGFHEFAQGKETLKVGVGSGVRVILKWDAWEGPPVDLDLFVLTADGQTVVASSRDTQDRAGQAPVEFISRPLPQAQRGQSYIIVVRANGPVRPVRIDLFAANTGELELLTPVSSLSSPGDARGALTVGAINVADDTLEDYSSQGPTLDGRQKPEISAPTRVTTASYTRLAPRPRPFDGTSAATPHVAGAAALLFGANQGATADQVQQFLTSRARDLNAPGPDNETGAGLLQLGDPAQRSGPAPTPGQGARPPATAPARGTAVAPPVQGGGTLAITPSSGPAGTVFAIQGTGFTPNESLALSVVNAADRRIAKGETQADARGGINITYNSTGDAPGQYRIVVESARGTVLAIGNYTVAGPGGGATTSPTARAGVPTPLPTPRPATAAPPTQPAAGGAPTQPAAGGGGGRPASGTVTVAPNAGPSGSRFVITGSGFPPNTQLIVAIITPGQQVLATAQPRTNASGGFTVNYTASGDPAGEYTVGVFSGDGNTVLGATTYTVR